MLLEQEEVLFQGLIFLTGVDLEMITFCIHDLADPTHERLHVLAKRRDNGIDSHHLFEFQVELEDQVFLLGEDLF